MLAGISDPLDNDIDSLREILLADLYVFFLYAFARIRGITPEIPQPIGRVTHLRTMADGFMAALRGVLNVLPILVPPRYAKTEMARAAIAWCYAHQPAANWIYASHTKTLAAEQTEYVRQIIQSRFFQTLFDARISKSVGAKDNFKTEQGGQTIAVGADGAGLGRGAGMTGNVPYGGAILLDDMLKTEEAHSVAARARVVRVYSQTLVNRRNSPETTPIISIAQRTHQQDLNGCLFDGVDERAIDVYQDEWRRNAIIIPALDDAGNALWPSKHSKEYLEKLKVTDEYTFHSQMQQNPISPSNRIFKVEHIKELKEEPKMLATFITGDTAETADEVNDATVFSMWGVYHIEFANQKVGMLGLHSINCHETRVQPEDLEEEFEEFYGACLRHPVKPVCVYIEKASTGSSLIGAIKNKPGLIVVDIQRKGGVREGWNVNKTERFKKSALYIMKGQVSIMRNAYHLEKLKQHLNAITFDGGQKHDDIADTFADAVRLALDEQVIYNNNTQSPNSDKVNRILAMNRQRRQVLSSHTGERRY